MSLRRPSRLVGALCAGAGVVALTAVGAAEPPAASAPTPAASSQAPRTKPAVGAEQGPAWATLKPAQRSALKPLERDWSGIDGLRKRKWLEIAERYPSMSPEDQARLQTRMAEWAALTPLERGQVRLNYQEAKQAPAQNRQASWDAYQALAPEQRRELADRAAPMATSASRAGPNATKTATAAAQAPSRTFDGPQPKSNTVPNPALAALPKPVAPTVVQVQPGATTTLISKQPAPPAHQPTGMPKIAATPEFVDEKTLLPQTGAQSTAAGRPTAASAPSARP
jgi:hypothetical protein